MATPTHDQPWVPVSANWLAVPPGQYDATIARALCSVSTWSYTQMDRYGFLRSAPAYVYVANDALFMDHLAWLIQSEDGRVVILCFRGTPPLSIMGSELGSPDRP